MHYRQMETLQFPTIWAVLSILLDTQDCTLEYVQYFQYAYDKYYEIKTKEHMQKLEVKSMQI